MNSEIFNSILNKYPQIGLPIKEGTKDTEEYKNAVLRGLKIKKVANDFSDSKLDSLEISNTPAGDVNILYINNRKDFEIAIQKLAHKCEPTNIPASMGASTISGLINWEKIHNHEKEYKKSGEPFWDLEFHLFTQDAANYKDSLIILSGGNYSAVGVDNINKQLEEEEALTERKWKKASIIIRKYHELTHFVCQKLYPEHKNAIRDEIIADAMGIIAAFGNYKPKVARLFLGLEGRKYREGGRLQNYYFDNDPQEVQKTARELIRKLATYLKNKPLDNIYDTIKLVEDNKIGL